MIVVLAGTQTEFHNYVEAKRPMGTPKDYFVFAGSKRRLQGIVVDDFRMIGTFWSREDATELYQLTVRLKGERDGNRKPSSPSHGNPSHGTNNSAGTLIPATFAPINTVTPPTGQARITAGEITTHRFWLALSDGCLASLVAKYLWHPDMTAIGDLDALYNGIPGGIYSAKDENWLLSLYSPANVTALNWLDQGDVLIVGAAKGTVKIWGEAIECEYGYRSQFAKMTSLDWGWGDFDLDYYRRRYLGVTDGTPRRNDRKYNPDD